MAFGKTISISIHISYRSMINLRFYRKCWEEILVEAMVAVSHSFSWCWSVSLESLWDTLLRRHNRKWDWNACKQVDSILSFVLGNMNRLFLPNELQETLFFLCSCIKELIIHCHECAISFLVCTWDGCWLWMIVLSNWNISIHEDVSYLSYRTKCYKAMGRGCFPSQLNQDFIKPRNLSSLYYDWWYNGFIHIGIWGFGGLHLTAVWFTWLKICHFNPFWHLP